MVNQQGVEISIPVAAGRCRVGTEKFSPFKKIMDIL